MPRLWLANAEEALPEDDSFYRYFFQQKTLRMFPRFLTCLKPGDCLVIPSRVIDDYAEYMAGLLKLGKTSDFLMSVNLASSCALVDSILEDKDALARIKQRFCHDGWVIEPYIDTRNVFRLVEELGIPTIGTSEAVVDSGLIDELNDKAYFKEFAASAGVAKVPGMLATNASELESCIYKMDAMLKASCDSQPFIMLRKVKFAGGAGNLSGTLKELMEKIPSWYSIGKVLVEPFLDIVSVAGSLARLTDKGTVFLGVDRQVFQHGGWCGFDFPFHSQDEHPTFGVDLELDVAGDPFGSALNGSAFIMQQGMDSSQQCSNAAGLVEHAQGLARSSVPCRCSSCLNVEIIRDKTIELAELARNKGARGYINIDWAFCRDNMDMPVALECNFRHNGFGYVVEFAEKYFGDSWNNMVMRCRENVKTSAKDFRTLQDILGFITYRGEPVLINKPGCKRGAVVTMPPNDNSFAVAVFGDTCDYADAVLNLIETSV